MINMVYRLVISRALWLRFISRVRGDGKTAAGVIRELIENYLK